MKMNQIFSVMVAVLFCCFGCDEEGGGDSQSLDSEKEGTDAALGCTEGDMRCVEDLIEECQSGEWIAVDDCAGVNQNCLETEGRYECADVDDIGCGTDCYELTWISIPGGSYQMGSNDGSPGETPVHEVTVPSFELTRTEVTSAQYAECVAAGICTEPFIYGYECNWDDSRYEDHPMNCVDWYQSRSFCEWVDGRLPSEAEWEYAARSGGQDIVYPWGDETVTCDYAVINGDTGYYCGEEHTWAVCSKPAGNTEQGLCDMAGNVLEWVEDWYQVGYEGAPTDGSAWVPEDEEEEAIRRTCGGSGGPGILDQYRASYREMYGPSDDSADLGFRCAR